MNRLITRPLLALIRVYQLVLSPWLGANCRFQPSCSQYAQEALAMHGALRGGWLTVKRIVRCHPGGGSGFDPPPAPAPSQLPSPPSPTPTPSPMPPPLNGLRGWRERPPSPSPTPPAHPRHV